MTWCFTAIRGRLTWLASVLILGVFAPVTAVAQALPPGQALSEVEARALAQRAALEGNLRLADAISSAILAQNPDDPQALLVRALVARGVGNPDDALEFAGRAYRLSDNPALRFDAAMLAADIQASRERFTSAQIWLRRADQAAPDAPRRRLVTQAYRQVARRNPLQFQFRFGVRPTNNVNNGAETVVIEIGGLPFVLDPSGQQLGGYEASAGASFAYRLSASETRRTDAVGEVYYRKIWLDSSAKARAPGAEGSDFDYGVIVGGIRHQRLIWPEIGPSRVTGVVGQSWYGGAGLARWGELQLGQTVNQGGNRRLNFGAVVRTEKRLDDDINSSASLGLSAEALRPAANGSYSVGGAIKNVWSDSGTVDHFSTSLFARRAFDRVGAVRPSVRASVEQRIYHKFATAPGGREDLSVSFGVDIVWPEVSFYGFQPRLSLLARRTLSNVDIYDRNEYSIGLSAVSRF